MRSTSLGRIDGPSLLGSGGGGAAGRLRRSRLRRSERDAEVRALLLEELPEALEELPEEPAEALSEELDSSDRSEELLSSSTAEAGGRG